MSPMRGDLFAPNLRATPLSIAHKRCAVDIQKDKIRSPTCRLDPWRPPCLSMVREDLSFAAGGQRQLPVGLRRRHRRHRQGQYIKCLTVLDEFTRECLAIDV